MGYRIDVDYSIIVQTAKTIDDYVGILESGMSQMNEEVKQLSGVWGNAEHNSFMNKWNMVDDNDSTYMNMKNELKNYSDKLRKAAGKYKECQEKAINAANRL